MARDTRKGGLRKKVIYSRKDSLSLVEKGKNRRTLRVSDSNGRSDVAGRWGQISKNKDNEEGKVGLCA